MFYEIVALGLQFPLVQESGFTIRRQSVRANFNHFRRVVRGTIRRIP